MSSTPKYGEFACKVIDVLVSISDTKPAIFTRCIADPAKPLEVITHTVRLDNAASLRIGLDELRSAFPAELHNLDTEQVLTKLMTETTSFVGKDVRVSVEPQLKNNVQVRGPQGQPYFNVRLRSNVRNLDAQTASLIAKRLLAASVKEEEIAGAFEAQ